MIRTKEMAHQEKEALAAKGETYFTPINSVSTPETGLTLTSSKLLDLSKGAITELAQDVVSDYLDGYKSPSEGLFFAKKLKELAETIEKNLSDPAANELKIVKGEKREFMGATVTEQMVGVRYSFKECGDPVWNDLKEKITNREEFLKTIKGSKQELIEETGEVVQIFEPIKSGKMGLIFKY